MKPAQGVAEAAVDKLQLDTGLIETYATVGTDTYSETIANGAESSSDAAASVSDAAVTALAMDNSQIEADALVSLDTLNGTLAQGVIESAATAQQTGESYTTALDASLAGVVMLQRTRQIWYRLNSNWV